MAVAVNDTLSVVKGEHWVGEGRLYKAKTKEGPESISTMIFHQQLWSSYLS